MFTLANGTNEGFGTSKVVIRYLLVHAVTCFVGVLVHEYASILYYKYIPFKLQIQIHLVIRLNEWSFNEGNYMKESSRTGF